MPKWAYAALVAATPAVTVPDDWPDGWPFPGPPWPPGFEDASASFTSPSPADDGTGIASNPTLEWTFDLDGVASTNFEVFLDGVNDGDASVESYALSGLADETEFDWRIIAKVGSTWYVGPEWTFSTKLAKPLNLAAAAASATQINLTWTDASAAEDNYLVERSPNGSTGWAQIASKAAGSTSHSDTGLTAETQYFYRVRAYDATLGYSDYSDVANDTTDSAVDHFIVQSISDPCVRGVTKTVYVTAKDAGGNTITDYTGTIVFTSTDGAATLPANYTFVPSDNGIHGFINKVILRTLGEQSVTATDGGATGSQTAITVIAAKTNVSPSVGGGGLDASKATYPPDTGTIAINGFTNLVGQYVGANYIKYRMYRVYVVPAGTIESALIRVSPTGSPGGVSWDGVAYSVPDWGTFGIEDWASTPKDLLGSGTAAYPSYTIPCDVTKIPTGATMYVQFLSSKDLSDTPPDPAGEAHYTSTAVLEITWALA